MIPPPIPGDPETVLRLAGELDAAGEHLASSARVLTSLDVEASWASPAGEAFARRVHGCPPVMTMAARRYAAAAAALRALARELAECQAEATRASRAHEVGRANDERIQGVLDALPETGSPADAVIRASLRAKQIGELEVAASAQRQHAAAWAAYRRADRRCARELAQCSADALTDPLAYRFLHARIAFDGKAAAAAGWAGKGGLRAAALVTIAAEADAITSRLVLSWVYGEGSARETLTDQGAKALIEGAGLAGAAARAGGLLAKQAGPVRYLSPRQRAVEGWHAYASGAKWNPHRPKPANPPAVRREPVQGVAAGGARPTGLRAATTRGKAAVRASAPVQEVRGYLDDWAIATRNGRGPRALMAASIGVRVVDSTVRKSGTARALADQATALGMRPEIRPSPGHPGPAPPQPPSGSTPRPSPGASGGTSAGSGGRGEQEPDCERPVLRGIPGLPSAPPTYP
ncbi:hypothetical protein ACQP1U_06925 [Actinomycetota bacterium]